MVYLHLNKSQYIKGEDIGFTAYVFNKESKKPFSITTNLYVSLENEENNINKKTLLKVENGVAYTVIPIDSTFSSGNYTIKAYTNWMRNFNERNYFSEMVKIIDVDETSKSIAVSSNDRLDAQFLPEGGHLLNNVINNVGVVIKDEDGLGVPDVKGVVLDKNGLPITEFKVNHLGIGKFMLLADLNNNYTIKLNHNTKVHEFKLNQTIERIGVTLSVKRLRNKAIVQLITNEESLAKIKNKNYALALHNGKAIDLVDVKFDSETTLNKIFDLNDLPTGINMFTLFNEDNQPIVERLFFNYKGLDLVKSHNLTAKQIGDSIALNLNFKDIDPNQFNNLSVSVLPKDTESYKHHHNMLSHTFLKPYVKGPIEQARYYFTDIDTHKKLELDNLLITQGWSSYNWNTIFNNTNTFNYPFENGISVKANFNSNELNDEMDSKYMVYYIDNDEDFGVSESETGKTNYWVNNLYPEENSVLNVSKISENHDLNSPSYYLQFFPSQIPNINATNGLKTSKTRFKNDISAISGGNLIIELSRNIQKLDEVLVKAKLNPTLERQNKLSAGRFGRLFVVDEDMENSYAFLSDFLRSRGMIVLEERGGFSARFPFMNQTAGSNGPRSANMFLDDMLMIDNSFFVRLFMSNIDYIEINRWGMGDAMRSPQGFVKVYTKGIDHPRFKKNRNKSKAYEFPLTFSKPKKFYAPKYRYKNDEFYKKYGTIDWKPNLTVDAYGNISIKVEQPEVPITLLIEGIANDGSFIFEEKTISLN